MAQDKTSEGMYAEFVDGLWVLPEHKTAGDSLIVRQEYRGFVVDGGGYDWNGRNPHPGGHTRLSPVFKELLVNSSSGIKCFLTSDWYSLESGAPWFTPLVEQLRAADALLAIITRPEAFRSLWMSFEIGAGFGSGAGTANVFLKSWTRSP